MIQLGIVAYPDISADHTVRPYLDVYSDLSSRMDYRSRMNLGRDLRILH
jgi:hypothetical protein